MPEEIERIQSFIEKRAANIPAGNPDSVMLEGILAQFKKYLEDKDSTSFKPTFGASRVLGDVLNYARVLNGHTQGFTAATIGLTNSNYAQLERFGEGKITEKIHDGISRYLGFTPEEIAKLASDVEEQQLELASQLPFALSPVSASSTIQVGRNRDVNVLRLFTTAPSYIRWTGLDNRNTPPSYLEHDLLRVRIGIVRSDAHKETIDQHLQTVTQLITLPFRAYHNAI